MDSFYSEEGRRNVIRRFLKWEEESASSSGGGETRALLQKIKRQAGMKAQEEMGMQFDYDEALNDPDLDQSYSLFSRLFQPWRYSGKIMFSSSMQETYALARIVESRLIEEEKGYRKVMGLAMDKIGRILEEKMEKAERRERLEKQQLLYPYYPSFPPSSPSHSAQASSSMSTMATLAATMPTMPTIPPMPPPLPLQFAPSEDFTLEKTGILSPGPGAPSSIMLRNSMNSISSGSLSSSYLSPTHQLQMSSIPLSSPAVPSSAPSSSFYTFTEDDALLLARRYATKHSSSWSWFDESTGEDKLVLDFRGEELNAVTTKSTTHWYTRVGKTVANFRKAGPYTVSTIIILTLIITLSYRLSKLYIQAAKNAKNAAIKWRERRRTG